MMGSREGEENPLEDYKICLFTHIFCVLLYLSLIIITFLLKSLAAYHMVMYIKVPFHATISWLISLLHSLTHSHSINGLLSFD